MKSFIKKIAKPIAIGVFFMALFFNVKVSLQNPFVRMDNAALAQSSSDTGGSVKCYSILQGTEGQSVACSPCNLATGIPPWYHFGGTCTPS